MSDRQIRFHLLGRQLYGASGVLLGVIGLLSQDFAAVWQPIENLGVDEHRSTVAPVYAFAFLVAGATALFSRFARYGFLALMGLHAISLLGWIPRVVATPAVGTLNGIAEMLALVVGGLVAYAAFQPRATPFREGHILFASCAFWFGVTHWVEFDATAGVVPKWLPLQGHFWAAATGVFYVLTSAAIVTGMQALRATRLCTAMMLGFAALIWIPMLIAEPSHFNFCGTTITLALAASAWVVADSIAQTATSSTPLASQPAL